MESEIREQIVALDRLETFTQGDHDLENELAGLYLATAEAYLDEMARAVAMGGNWSKTAHALKGASANFGAVRVAALARDAEHGEVSAHQLAIIRDEFQKVADFFASRTR